MINKLVLVLLVICLSACTKVGSMYNYKGSVVVAKGGIVKQTVQLRIYKENKYTLQWLRVPIGEYQMFNLNDTIK